MIKLGIFGIGCIGSVLTKYLIQNDANIYYLFNRSEKNEISISFQTKNIRIPIRIESNTDIKLDWLIVCLKEYQYGQAKKDLERLINTDTKIVVFRNGIDLSSFFLEFTTEESILETIIDCPTQKDQKGQILQLSNPKISLPNLNIARSFVELFSVNHEIEWIYTDDFKRQQWEKLIESSSLGAVQVLTMKPAIILQEEKYFQVFRMLIQEAIAVAHLEEIELENSFEQTLLEKALSYPPNKGSSMLTDKLNGRPLEMQAKIGIILEKAEYHKIAVPTTMKVFHNISESNPLQRCPQTHSLRFKIDPK